MEFSRQEYWSGLPFPFPGHLTNLGLNLDLLHCRQILYHLSYQGSPQHVDYSQLFHIVYCKIVKSNLRSSNHKKYETEKMDILISLMLIIFCHVYLNKKISCCTPEIFIAVILKNKIINSFGFPKLHLHRSVKSYYRSTQYIWILNDTYHYKANIKGLAGILYHLSNIEMLCSSLFHKCVPCL